MTWYRGETDGRDAYATAGVWYAADREYAAFFGAVSEHDLSGLRALGLTGLGVDPEPEEVADAAPGAPEHSDCEIYLWAERADVQAWLREAGYDAVRLLQWHADYSGDPQVTLLVI